MAETRRSAGESVSVTSSRSDRMHVWHLLDFADAVRAAGIPENAEVIAHKSQVGHTSGLSVRHQWDIEPLGYEPAPETPPGVPDLDAEPPAATTPTSDRSRT